MKSLVMPGGVLLLAVVVLASSGWMPLALPALSFLEYCALIGGMLLAWRFHSSRIFLCLLVLFLAGEVLTVSGPHLPAMISFRAVAILVPLNYVLIACMSERGFTVASITSVALFLFVQCVIVTVLSHISAANPLPATRAHHLATALSLPGYAVFLLAAAATFLGVRFLLTRKPVDAAFLWSLLAFGLSLRFMANLRISALYSVTAACILAVSIVENSYLLAYHDELTGLPARRAFNDALLALHAPYSIAVVDIDHFKNFNDTYGHDIGDEVLRLVAANLDRVTGGGQAFRFGGEEFTILFQGKITGEVIEHLEKLRERIQLAEFRMRSGERRQIPRGPDRRGQHSRPTKGQVIRQLAKEPAKAISVTVSIGVATGEEKSHPEGVLQAADKALYRAKANGRNRVETADRPRRVRAKSADIA